MRLLVDVGNTQVKHVFQNSEPLAAFSEVCYSNYQCFKEKLASKAFADVTEVVLASVHNDELSTVVKVWAQERDIAFMQVESQAHAFGVSSSYCQPSHLGVDRWLALIAVHRLYPNQNVLIVDTGTATTVDLLAANGHHRGGWIMPGVDTMFDSLLNNTKKIIAEPIDTTSLSFGVNSSQCVNHGIWAMIIGAVKEAIVQANEVLTVNKVVLTGGNSKTVAKLLNKDSELVPELLFHGLSCFKSP